MAGALAGKVALVTGVGAAGQIGHAVAQGMGQAGAKVVMVGRDEKDIAAHVKAFGAAGIEAQGRGFDLATTDGARAAVGLATSTYGGLDAVVNLAGGFVGAGPVLLIAPTAVEDALAQNLKTAFFVSQAAIPALAARGGGSITNFASIAAIKPTRHMAAYAAAKSAVAGLTRALALELRDEHIRVNALAPGMVRTASNVKSVGDNAKTRWVELDQIVAAVCYLASDAARAVSGQIIAVTAGDL